MMKKVDMIVDLQYGSTGKGLIAGYLAETNGYDMVINANMPNAGHTYINDEGRVWIHKVLPNGIVSPNLKYVMIAGGSVFCPNRLAKEISESEDILKDATIMIHPNAVPLVFGDGLAEKDMVESIGSTGQGSAAAMARKIARLPSQNVIARDALHDHPVGKYVVNHEQWTAALTNAESILAECAQGFSLGIDQEFYPYCTSRNCTPSRFMSDMGLPHKWLNKVIGTCRTYPIRVAGNSGGHYIDQEEISWDSLNVEPEKTTVTKKVRRVFTFSEEQICEAIFHCQPDEIFLNFCNYQSDSDNETTISIIEGASALVSSPCRVKYVGFGAMKGDVHER